VGSALVSGGAGFLKCDGDRLAPALHLAAFAVTAALEFTVLELMHDPAGNALLLGVSLAIGFLPVSAFQKNGEPPHWFPSLGNDSFIPKLVDNRRRPLMAPVTKMRIHRFGSKEVLQADGVELLLPDAGQVLVAVRAASLNPVDFKIRSGKYPAVQDDRLPYTLGRDFSGVVEKCGAQATRFKPGDEVFGMVNIYGGGYAEKAVVDERAITLKPAGIDHIHAAAIPLQDRPLGRDCFVMED
jgi:hypothetical protein